MKHNFSSKVTLKENDCSHKRHNEQKRISKQITKNPSEMMRTTAQYSADLQVVPMGNLSHTNVKINFNSEVNDKETSGTTKLNISSEETKKETIDDQIYKLEQDLKKWKEIYFTRNTLQMQKARKRQDKIEEKLFRLEKQRVKEYRKSNLGVEKMNCWWYGKTKMIQNVPKLATAKYNSNTSSKEKCADINLKYQNDGQHDSNVESTPELLVFGGLRQKNKIQVYLPFDSLEFVNKQNILFKMRNSVANGKPFQTVGPYSVKSDV